MTRCQFCFYWGWRKDLNLSPKPCTEIDNQLAGKGHTGPDDTCDKHRFYDRWAVMRRASRAIPGTMTWCGSACAGRRSIRRRAS